jgi:hypothetical protein
MQTQAIRELKSVKPITREKSRLRKELYQKQLEMIENTALTLTGF